MKNRTKITNIRFPKFQTLSEILEDLRLKEYSEKPEVVSRSCPYQKDLHENNRHSCEGCVGTNCKRLAEIGLNDDWGPLDSSLLPTCGAKTRAGHRCRKKIVPGKRRCRFHGGLSTGPKTIEGRQRIREAQLRRWAAKRHKNVVPTELVNIPSSSDPNEQERATKQLRRLRKVRKISPMAL